MSRAGDALAARRFQAHGRVRLFWLIVALYVLVALFGPITAPYGVAKIGGAAPFLGPSTAHWLGTDSLGRDLFSRLLVGARVGVLVGIASVAIALVLGSAMGTLAGYLGGPVDAGVSLVTDFLFAFPEFLLGIIVIAAMGPGLWHAALAIGIVYTPRFARVARGEVLGMRRASYIEAALLARRSSGWIVWRHILPNVAGPLGVLTALSLSTAQLTYAGLSFLGFGARPPIPDYGQMLATGTVHMLQDPLLVLGPAIALSLLVFGFIVLGDLARDMLDPRIGRAGSGWTTKEGELG